MWPLPVLAANCAAATHPPNVQSRSLRTPPNLLEGSCTALHRSRTFWFFSRICVCLPSNRSRCTCAYVQLYSRFFCTHAHTYQFDSTTTFEVLVPVDQNKELDLGGLMQRRVFVRVFDVLARCYSRHDVGVGLQNYVLGSNLVKAQLGRSRKRLEVEVKVQAKRPFSQNGSNVNVNRQ